VKREESVKIRLVKNARLETVPSITILQGSTIDLPEETAMKWIEGGHAVLLEEIETTILPPSETAVMLKPKKS
jgi:hypothetical protein